MADTLLPRSFAASKEIPMLMFENVKTVEEAGFNADRLEPIQNRNGQGEQLDAEA